FLVSLFQVSVISEEANESRIKQHIKNLASASSNTVNQSASALVKIGKPVIPYLIDAYEKPLNVAHRHYIVYTAISLEDPTVIPLLVRYLEDENKKIDDYHNELEKIDSKRSRLGVLGDLYQENVRPPTISTDTRILTIETLAKWRETKVIPLFLKIIKTVPHQNSLIKPQEQKVRQQVVRMLSRYVETPNPDPQIIATLLELLGDKDKEVVVWALYGLNRAKYTGEPEGIIKLLTHTDKTVVEYGLSALGNLKVSKALEHIKKRVNDSNSFIKSSAQATLRDINAEPPVLSPTILSQDIPVAKGFSYPTMNYMRNSSRKSFGVLGDSKGQSVIHPAGAGWERSNIAVAHLGDDCGWGEDGASVYAIADGVVRLVCHLSPVSEKYQHWGWLVVVEHKMEEKTGTKYICSLYGHLGSDIKVKKDEMVKKGQKLGTIGMGLSQENGNSEAHLHLGIYEGSYHYSPGTKISLDGVMIKVIESKQPSVYVAIEDSSDSEEEQQKFLLFEYSTCREGAISFTYSKHPISGLSDDEITGIIKGNHGENNLHYARWIKEYGRKEEGITGWLDPLKFLRSGGR
ncbi:MAG: peptidoglycan DD-metalloendopeptidase family protein, partial [Planctomycetota bacterium]|nr:peptidoglycan DD-metalloendopeptidase family protein [Planctomycetota bacterium]